MSKHSTGAPAAPEPATKASSISASAPDGPAAISGSSVILSWCSFAWTPDPSIPYGFLLIAYVVLALCSLSLLAVQLFGGENGESVKGYWLVPAPAAPLCLWAVFMRARANKLLAASPDKKDQ